MPHDEYELERLVFGYQSLRRIRSEPEPPPTVRCEECGRESHRMLVRQIHGRVVCRECSAHMTRCHHCLDWFEDDDMVHDDSSSYCRGCYEDNYFRCRDCERLVHYDYAVRDNICSDCGTHSEYIHPYDYAPVPLFKGTNAPFYGLELETDEYGSTLDEAASDLFHRWSDYENEFYLKEDGSLCYGFEIVFHPRNIKSWVGYEERLNKIAGTVRDHGGKSFSTSTCGIHVHRSRRDISRLTELKLLMFFGLHSNKVVKVAQRRNDDYANLHFFEINGGNKYAYKYVKHEAHQDKYYAINFGKRDTIEFRVFKGTLKISSLLAYVFFSHYVTEFCKHSLLSVFTEQAVIHSWKDFIGFVRAKSMREVGAANLMEYLVRREVCV